MNPIEQLKSNFDQIHKILLENNNPSLASDIDNYYKKTLILSIASQNEKQIYEILYDFVKHKSNNDEKIISFLKMQAIYGKFHQLFEWGNNDDLEPGKNANKFFRLFGATFLSEAKIEISKNNQLDVGIKSFIEIGHLRNLLIHNDFTTYEINTKTTDDVFTLFKNTKFFISFLRQKLLPS